MRINKYLFFSLILMISACKVKKANQNIEHVGEWNLINELPKPVWKFAEMITNENPSIHSYELFSSHYPDVQMLFEMEGIVRFSALTNKSYLKDNNPNNYEAYLLFIGTYETLESAKNVFTHLKSHANIRISDLEGLAGRGVEQVQVLERIRATGGMFTQKGKYVFYLVETCGAPPIEANWEDYEKLFLKFITKENEEIEVINADCRKDKLKIQKMKARS